MTNTELASLTHNAEALAAALNATEADINTAYDIGGMPAVRPYLARMLALIAADAIIIMPDLTDEERATLLDELLAADYSELVDQYGTGHDYITRHLNPQLAAMRRKSDPCHRCGGLGIITRFMNSHGGICYGCNGTGRSR